MSMYNLIQRLKAFDADRCDLDELVFLHSESRSAAAAYVDNGLMVPEWLTDATAQISQEISTRRRDQLIKEAKLLDVQEQALKTRSEKRDQIASRRAEIDRLLGRTTTTVAAPVTQPAAVESPTGSTESE
jgi:hypothetical protein